MTDRSAILHDHVIWPRQVRLRESPGEISVSAAFMTSEVPLGSELQPPTPMAQIQLVRGGMHPRQWLTLPRPGGPAHIGPHSGVPSEPEKEMGREILSE